MYSGYAEALVPEPVISSETVILGMGKTGLSCARYLGSRDIDVTLLDTRDNPPGLADVERALPGVQIYTGTRMPADGGCMRRLVLSPGVARSHPFVTEALRNGVEVVGDIELFAREVSAPVLAVTGSNGKSTVVTMVAEILRAAGKRTLVGGNIGTPALDLLCEEAPDCYVLELSSFQLESTASLAPLAACILNLSDDHMDRYGDFAEYVAAKTRIYRRAANVVLNADDEVLRQLEPACPTEYISLRGGDEAAYHVERLGGTEWLVAHGERVVDCAALALQDEHNYLNALAAIAITDALKIERSAQARGLATVRGLPHRCERVACVGDVDWINDSKGTNVGAACAAIRSVFQHRGGVLIAGGQRKGADFAALGEVVGRYVHTVVLIGEDAKKIAAVLDDGIDTCFAVDMAAAVAIAATAAGSGEAVLLSPACASLDMYENFEARGRAFVSAVRALEPR